MQYQYPTPEEVGIDIPNNLKEDRYKAGFRHALKGGQLDHVEFLRQSFREGFRAAKPYLRWLRRQQGIIEFPMKGKIRFTSTF